jgi:hypothetical protein
MGGRNPERVRNRAAAIEAEYVAGDEVGAMVSFDVGDWWMDAMAAHLPPEMVSHLRAMQRALEPHRKWLDDLAYEIAVDAAAEETCRLDIEMSWPAWEAAARVLLAGGDREAAEDAAEASVPA